MPLLSFELPVVSCELGVVSAVVGAKRESSGIVQADKRG